MLFKVICNELYKFIKSCNYWRCFIIVISTGLDLFIVVFYWVISRVVNKTELILCNSIYYDTEPELIL